MKKHMSRTPAATPRTVDPAPLAEVIGGATFADLAAAAIAGGAEGAAGAGRPASRVWGDDWMTTK